MKKQITALFLCLAMALSLTACSNGRGQAEASPSPSTVQPSAAPSPSPSPEPSEGPSGGELEAVRFAVLSGPTGVGAAKLIADNEAGETLNHYDVTVEADNPTIAAKLQTGELDIAAMASNVSANLYNKSGCIQALCLSTLGVLYILERGEPGAAPAITSLGDLRGETVYAAGEGANPQYVLEYLLRENELDPEKDVSIVWQTAEEVQANLLSGEARYAMLPVPAATAVIAKSKLSSANDGDVHKALDLTGEWNKVNNTGVLTMTTVVVRKDFAQQHPEAVDAFLQDYQASIEYVNANVEEAAQLVEKYGIVPSAAIAKEAIPDCNLVFIAGEEMRDQIQGYYGVLCDANPDSIGGGLPDDGFYYISD